MSTRSGRVRSSVVETSPIRTRKGVSPPRSPARTRKTSPALKSSPARKSSPPARSSRKSPSRKSPSRKPASKFPARKSPSRSTKESSENEKNSPTKRPAIKTDRDVSVKLENLSAKMEYYRSTRSKRTEYSIKDVITSTSNELPELDKVNGLDSYDEFGLRNRRSVEEIPPRRSSRLKEFMDNVPDIRRSLSKSISKSVSKSISQSIDAYSDEENSEEDLMKEKFKPVNRKLATPLRGSESKIVQMGSRWEFGGRAGSALFIVLIPVVVFFILASCMNAGMNACSAKSVLNIKHYKSIGLWLTLQAGIFCLSQYLVQAVFAVVPFFGIKADRLDETGTKYCFNAFFASIFNVNALFFLDFFQLLDKESLTYEYLQLATVSYIFAVFLSIILYSRNVDSSELNLYGSTGYKLYDFFMGREVHPFIKKLDVKIWLSRVSNVNSLILTVLILQKGLHFESTDVGELSISNLKDMLQKLQTKPTILLFSLMQLIYILNFVMKEHKVTTTFFWQSEGVGYLQAVSSALYPFYFTTISKFVADAQLSLSTNILVSASVLYVLGFFIMLISNNIKHEFRTNPLQPGITKLDSMPTFHGKKLLVSSLWGILRHPNYTGDILIHIALALPGIVSGRYVAAAPALLTILVLLHRAWRDHARCNRRYGAAWNRYCKRVPSVIIPKVL